MPDTYTDDEICGFYRDGKDDPHIIRKISQLALKPEDEIITILHNAGKALHIKYDPNRCKPHRVSKITDDVWRAAINAKLKGTDPEQICVAYHISHNYLRSNWRKKAKELGISLPDHRISSGVQCIPDKIRKEVEQMEDKKIFPSSPETVTPVFSPIKAAIMASVDAYEATQRELGKALGLNISAHDREFSVSYTVLMEEHTS